jgi:hypothetical protein
VAFTRHFSACPSENNNSSTGAPQELSRVPLITTNHDLFYSFSPHYGAEGPQFLNLGHIPTPNHIISGQFRKNPGQFRMNPWQFSMNLTPLAIPAHFASTDSLNHSLAS